MRVLDILAQQRHLQKVRKVYIAHAAHVVSCWQTYDGFIVMTYKLSRLTGILIAPVKHKAIGRQVKLFHILGQIDTVPLLPIGHLAGIERLTTLEINIADARHTCYCLEFGIDSVSQVARLKHPTHIEF